METEKLIKKLICPRQGRCKAKTKCPLPKHMQLRLRENYYPNEVACDLFPLSLEE